MEQEGDSGREKYEQRDEVKGEEEGEGMKRKWRSWRKKQRKKNRKKQKKLAHH